MLPFGSSINNFTFPMLIRARRWEGTRRILSPLGPSAISQNNFPFQLSYKVTHKHTHLYEFRDRKDDNQRGPQVLDIGNRCQQMCHLDLFCHVLRVLVHCHHEPRCAHGKADVLEAVLAGDIKDMVDHGGDVIVAGLVPTENF